MEAEVKLKKYVEEHGISQAFICDKTGIDKSTMSKILAGKRKLTANELILIAKALEVSDIFFTEEVIS